MEYALRQLRGFRRERTMHTLMGKNTPDLLTILAANVKASREKLGYSQMKLADEADLSVGYINDIEQARKWVSRRSLEKLCDALLVEPWMLLLPKQPAVGVQDADLVKHIALSMQKNVSVTVAETLQDLLGGLTRGSQADEGSNVAADRADTAGHAGPDTDGGRREDPGTHADHRRTAEPANGAVPFEKAHPQQDPFNVDEADARNRDHNRDGEQSPDHGSTDDAATDGEGRSDKG